jgi:hypothetical protein
MNWQNSRKQPELSFGLEEIRPEIVAPLSGPLVGVTGRAKRRWHKPLPAIIADATANSRAVLARLERGMYIPDLECKPQYQKIYNELYQRTLDQLKALAAFSVIGWRE